MIACDLFDLRKQVDWRAYFFWLKSRCPQPESFVELVGEKAGIDIWA